MTIKCIDNELGTVSSAYVKNFPKNIYPIPLLHPGLETHMILKSEGFNIGGVILSPEGVFFIYLFKKYTHIYNCAAVIV